jgi:UDP-galactopyranose mutase
MSDTNVLIVGAGFSGAVLARQLVENSTHRVLVIDSRPHVAGNCHTERDPETEVMVHRYGPHIFNTNHVDVWNYIQRFAEWMPYINRVKAVNRRGVFSLPINLHTINQFFGQTFSPAEAREFIGTLGDKSIKEPQNFEEQALSLLGRDLYEAFFYGYTKKQWGCEPTELPASILKRLPVRFNYDDNYYNSRFQAIPKDGYTCVVERLLDHPAISVQLGTTFGPEMSADYRRVFYAGPLDAFYGYRFGRLGYRTVEFEPFRGEGDLQGNAVINQGEPSVPYTRTHEHKHFAPWETHAKSIVFREFSKETGQEDVPYYPKRLAADLAGLEKYTALAQQEPKVVFMGRLGTYRYLDMDQIVGEALDLAQCVIQLGMDATLPILAPRLK